MPKPQTDEQFVADIARRIQRRHHKAPGYSSAPNLAFAVASMVVGQMPDEGQRDITVLKFVAAFRGSVDKYLAGAKTGVDRAKSRA
jgi:hypothetical protein